MEEVQLLGIKLSIQDFKSIIHEAVNTALQDQLNSDPMDELWSIEQASDYLGITRQTLTRIANRGDISPMKITGKAVRYWKKDVMNYLERCKH